MEKEIKITKNYSIFKYYKGNRDVEKNHIRKLTSLLEETGGNIQPVLVNSNMVVIDGQHRITVCERLNLPVKYMRLDLNDKDTMKTIMNINSGSKNWTDKTRLLSWAKLDVPGYKYYASLISITIPFSMVKELGKIKSKDIVNGKELDILDDIDEKIELVEKILIINRQITGESVRKREIVRAINTLEEIIQERNSKGEFIKKLDLDKIGRSFKNVIGDYGIADRPRAIAVALAKALDFKKKDKIYLMGK